MAEHLHPIPLPEDVTVDDLEEDVARAQMTVAELVADDLEDPTTPSRKARRGDPLEAGYQVPTEPAGLDMDRPVNDVDGI